MIFLSTAILALVAAPVVRAAPGKKPPPKPKEKGLNDYARAIGKVYFGTAADYPVLSPTWRY